VLAALPQLYELDLSAFTLPVFIDLVMNHPGRFSELIWSSQVWVGGLFGSVHSRSNKS